MYFDKFTMEHEEDEEEITNILSKLFATIDIRRQDKLIEKANMVHSLVCNEELDVSVLVFEVMYEVLKSWKFSDFKYVAVINDGGYPDIQKQIGEKMDILISFVNQAYINVKEYGYQNAVVKSVKNNLYGKIFWYFANIFCDEYVPYVEFNECMQDVKDELEVAKQYCEFCEMVQ